MNTSEVFRLDGQVAIVTGGRGLYGASICAALCEMGAVVVVASRNEAKCEEYAVRLCGPVLRPVTARCHYCCAGLRQCRAVGK